MRVFHAQCSHVCSTISLGASRVPRARVVLKQPRDPGGSVYIHARTVHVDPRTLTTTYASAAALEGVDVRGSTHAVKYKLKRAPGGAQNSSVDVEPFVQAGTPRG